MYYDKQIHYIDYLENGEKKYNCGYVKITVSGGRLVLEMQIKGLYETDDVAAEVMLEGAGTESRIGSAMILQGGGSFRWEIRDPVKEGEEMSLREGLRYGQLERILVHISPRRSLQCVWRKSAAAQAQLPQSEEILPVKQAVSALPEEQLSKPEEEVLPEQPVSEGNQLLQPEVLPPEPASAAEVREIPAANIIAEMSREPAELVREPAKMVREPAKMADAAQETFGAAMPGQRDIRNEEMQQKQYGEEDPQIRETQRRLHGPRTAAMSEDKWRQLWKIYPHIRPFRDEREYLSLWPEDFVVLRSDAYRLSHNSFLLHGYYNYEHLILTQMSVNGTNRYYIGVPGNFYEKEKQVAIMFGFESFECRQEPAREGDFGYYMIRVEL